MMNRGWVIGGALLAVATMTQAQAPNAEALLASQRQAMKALAKLDGVWRGTAVSVLPGGERRSVVQTERIGPFLGGTLKVIEGRGYDERGTVVFNAFGIVSFSPATSTYSMRSYAHGRQGDFPFQPTPDGYTWEVPAGPGAFIRYTAVIKDGRLHEVGERVVPGGAAVRVFEMTLERVRDSDWPEVGAIGPK